MGRVRAVPRLCTCLTTEEKNRNLSVSGQSGDDGYDFIIIGVRPSDWLKAEINLHYSQTNTYIDKQINKQRYIDTQIDK